MQVLRLLLLFLGLVTNTTDLRLNLKNLVISLLNKLLDSLKSLISLLHAEKTLLPVLEESLLAHNDALDLNSSLFEGVTSGSCFLLLRDKLSLIQGLLLVQALDLLIHRIDE